MHVSQLLLAKGEEVVGIDNLNNYYEPTLKRDRLEQLNVYDNFEFVCGDICDTEILHKLFSKAKINKVIHLAAQAGVRYSLENPNIYTQSNVVGFGNILEMCRKYEIAHLVFASSSSVYGANSQVPFSVRDNVDHPISLYAATKKSNELMAHAYSHLYGLPTTGLRYFTVYGPWGRPDMAPWLFTSSILTGHPINVYNYGEMKRDFTYIDDIAEATISALHNIPEGYYKRTEDKQDQTGFVAIPHKIYNVGNGRPISLMDFIRLVEHNLGCEAVKNYMPLQAGDMITTFADIDETKVDLGFEPTRSLEFGIERWCKWYREYTDW